MLLKTVFLRVSLFCSINNYCKFSVSQITPLQNVSFPTAAEADNAKETGSKLVSQAVSLNFYFTYGQICRQQQICCVNLNQGRGGGNVNHII